MALEKLSPKERAGCSRSPGSGAEHPSYDEISEMGHGVRSLSPEVKKSGEPGDLEKTLGQPLFLWWMEEESKETSKQE